MVRLDFFAMKELASPALQLMGCSDAERKEVLESLYLADLMGHYSHGIGMIPRYVESYLAGHLKANQAIKVTKDLGSLLALDGCLGFGQSVGTQALNLATEHASKFGACIFLLANAHHIGRVGRLAEIAAGKKMVSIFFVNVLSRPVVSVWGGKTGKHGTNPICIGVPRSGDTPFILDFATSAVAQGKMREAHIRGEQAQNGLLRDSEGNPTNDPSVVVLPNANGEFGSIFPFGEHKGSGLAIACELLAGALSGGGVFNKEKILDKAIVNNLFGVLVSIDKLQEIDSYTNEVETFISWIKQEVIIDNIKPPFVAGEPEKQRKDLGERCGIDIPLETIQQIKDAVAKLKQSEELKRNVRA